MTNYTNIRVLILRRIHEVRYIHVYNVSSKSRRVSDVRLMYIMLIIMLNVLVLVSVLVH